MCEHVFYSAFGFSHNLINHHLSTLLILDGNRKKTEHRTINNIVSYDLLRIII